MPPTAVREQLRATCASPAGAQQVPGLHRQPRALFRHRGVQRATEPERGREGVRDGAGAERRRQAGADRIPEDVLSRRRPMPPDAATGMRIHRRRLRRGRRHRGGPACRRRGAVLLLEAGGDPRRRTPSGCPRTTTSRPSIPSPRRTRRCDGTSSSITMPTRAQQRDDREATAAGRALSARRHARRLHRAQRHDHHLSARCGLGRHRRHDRRCLVARRGHAALFRRVETAGTARPGGCSRARLDPTGHGFAGWLSTGASPRRARLRRRRADAAHPRLPLWRNCARPSGRSRAWRGSWDTRRPQRPAAARRPAPPASATRRCPPAATCATARASACSTWRGAIRTG